MKKIHWIGFGSGYMQLDAFFCNNFKILLHNSFRDNGNFCKVLSRNNSPDHCISSEYNAKLTGLNLLFYTEKKLLN